MAWAEERARLDREVEREFEERIVPRKKLGVEVRCPLPRPASTTRNAGDQTAPRPAGDDDAAVCPDTSHGTPPNNKAALATGGFSARCRSRVGYPAGTSALGGGIGRRDRDGRG
jgi:hypothetical protein